MEDNTVLIESLYEKTKEYANTTIELTKLKALDKTADVVSSLVPRLVLIIFILIFVFILNIAISFWLGELTGKIHYGFFIVAGFYMLIALIVYFMHPGIKKRISNAIITRLLN